MDFNSFISGFTEGEGCFCVSFNQRKRLSTGIEVRPSFSISQNKRNLDLLKKIFQSFGCGSIRFSKSDQNYKLEVRSIKDLKTVIIPFFDKYQLQGIKKNDFENFKIVCNMVYQNLHMNKKCLRDIIDISYQINVSGKRKYNKEELLKHVAS